MDAALLEGFPFLGCMFFGPGHPFFGPVHVFWIWPDFFWTWQRFKKCGDFPVCFLDPAGIFFWTCMYLCWTQVFFLTAKLIVSDVGFFFLDPCTCFVDLASIGWGGTSLL